MANFISKFPYSYMTDGNKMRFVYDVKREVVLAVVRPCVRLVCDDSRKWNDVVVDFTHTDDWAVAEHANAAAKKQWQSRLF